METTCRKPDVQGQIKSTHGDGAMRRQLWLLSVLAVVALLLLDGNQSAYAATFTVNSTADAVDTNPGDGVCADGSGNCTLRAAIMEVNALPGADTITLPAGTYTLTIPGAGEDAAATGDLDITGALTINGAGAASTIIDGGGLDRVFEVRPGATVQIDAVTVQNGNARTTGDSGGGIFNQGAMVLANSTVASNAASGGGGIWNYGGTLAISSSTIRNNDTFYYGSGIWNYGGVLTLTNSTVRNNDAGGYRTGGIANVGGNATLTNSTVNGNISTNQGAGGIVNWAATLTLINSTVSGNTGSGYGGGISNVYSGMVTLVNSTVSGNIDIYLNVPFVGGILNDSGTTTLKNTGVVNNGLADCSGSITSLGHNLASDASCALGGTGDMNNTDPLLGPLANNGGPTMTHALLDGSPAIDAVPLPDCTVSTDQRGVLRPQGAACDIGAFELVLNHPPVANAGPDQTVEATSSSGASVTLNGSGSSDPDGDPLTYNWTGPFGAASGVSPTVTLPLGTHTVTLMVSDGLATASDTVYITVQDTTPPDTTITSATDGNGAPVTNGGSTVSTSMAFGFTGTDAVGVASFQCSLDGAAFTSCTSPQSFAGLSVGGHTFQTRAVDTTGNTDPTPASRTWTVLTPAQAIQDLINTVNGMGLPSGVTTSLTAPLNNANTNNVPATCGKLNAFISQVNAKEANGQLTAAQADQLRQSANAIKASLGC